MRKWLAALFVWLMMIPMALAEGDLFAEVCGMWYWDGESPAAPLGDGVYFHADGTCQLFEAEAPVPPEQTIMMTVCADGTWTALGDTLMVAVGEEMHVLPVRVIPGPDPEYIDGVQIGEGKYLNFTGNDVDVPVESIIPPEIFKDIHGWYSAPDIEDYKELPDIDGKPMGFLLLRHEGERELWLYAFTEKGWRMDNVHTGGIPQIDLPYVSLGVSRGGGSYESRGSLWYDPEKHDFTYPDGPRIAVYTSNGETLEERVEYVWQDNDFRLVHYGDNPVCQIDVVEEDLLIFYNISDPGIDLVRYSLKRKISGVDFYDLPRRPEEVRVTGLDEPTIPADAEPFIMDRQSFLTVQDVKLKPGKYPVYMGPGKEFGRAANGKAAVSTGSWVQVFGLYDDWLLIHYAVSAEQYRFGWIHRDALPRSQPIAALPLVFGDIVNGDDVTLTDDPLNSRVPIVTLPCKWHELEYLAQLGEDYSLVRTVVDGKTWWGFIPSWSLGHG